MTRYNDAIYTGDGVHFYTRDPVTGKAVPYHRKEGEKEMTDVQEPQRPNVGDHVVYTDSVGKQHAALVTNVFTRDCANLAYVDLDEGQKDNYGQKLTRSTSCMRKSDMSAHGNFWTN